MGRPRTINPDGEVSQISFRLPATLADDIRAEARDTGRSVGAVVRDRLDKPIRRQAVLAAGLLSSATWNTGGGNALVTLDIIPDIQPVGVWERFPADARIVVTAETTT